MALVTRLTMNEVQNLITAVNESKLDQIVKNVLRSDLDLMADALMDHNSISVVTS